MPAHAFLDAPTPLAFAHRGFAPDGDENSLAAFDRAVALGFGYLETDVRVTADGVALAFHDATLDRTTDRHGHVERLPWREVRRARIAGREPIALLADVLNTWPRVRVNIDVKSSRSIRPTIDVIRRTGSLDRVCVAAFSTRRIAAVRAALGPSVCTACGPAGVISYRVARRTVHGRAGCVQAPATAAGRTFVDAAFVTAAHRAGLPVHVYTINDVAEMHRVLDAGVDGVMTDRADLLRGVLTDRGVWT